MGSDYDTKLILTILNSFNILLTALLIITYLTSKKLQHHPSGIIISIAFCELATSYHSSILMWGSESVIHFFTIDTMNIWHYVGLEDRVKSVTCSINVLIFTFGLVTGILYNIILCIDLMLSLRNPFSTAYKRMKYYHVFVFITSSVLSGYISTNFIKCLCIDKDLGCFTPKGHKSVTFQSRLNFIRVQEDILLPLTEVFVVLAVISILYAAYRMKFGLRISNVAFRSSFIRHIMYVSVNIIILGFLVCSIFFMDDPDLGEYFEATSGYVMSLGGVVLTVIRCTDQNFRIKISSGKLLEVEEEVEDDNEWNNSLAQLSQELTAELAWSIYDSLFLVYSQKMQVEIIEWKKDLAKRTRRYERDAKHSRLAQGLKIDARDMRSLVTEYCPELFESVIKDCEIQFSEISDSMDPLKNIASIGEASESKGKSGSFFMKTHNDSFIIKTVKESEIVAIKSMIQNYSAHLKSNKNSLLCKIFGAFLLSFPGITPIYIIVMENITKNINPTIIYDLKGSTLGRKTEVKFEGIEEKPSIGPFKDLDFLRSKKRIKCQNLEELTMVLSNDTNLLVKANVMDYSLLLCIEEIKEDGNENRFVVTYKIIDYLTYYGFFKKMERAFTVLMNPKKRGKASVISSELYARRFKGFILKRVFVKG